MKMTSLSNEPPKEAVTVRKITQYLNKHGGWVLKTHGGQYQRSGVPDLLYLHNGVLYAFEVKRRDTDLPTMLQAQTMARMTEAGAKCSVVRSVAEVVEVLTK